MPTLRILSVIYVLCAMAFSVEIAFDRDPPVERASRSAVRVTLEAIQTHAVRPGIHLAREGANYLIAEIRQASTQQNPTVTTAKPVHIAVAPLYRARVNIPPAPPLNWDEPKLTTRSFAPANTPDIRIAADAQPQFVRITRPRHVKPILSLAPPTSIAHASLTPAELTRVTMRLRENLTREMLNNFSLFLYVSKAEKGPWAQRLYVFRKDASGDLDMLHNWPASTGREKFEIAPNGTRQHSSTPAGYYQLDPTRMYREHFSGQWHEPMPYAMFFNWEKRGDQTGLAIHAATQMEVSQLGSRASAGCIRIAPENARLLFGLIRSEYKGLAPRFAFNNHTATMSNNGALMHDPAGNLKMADGYKVLVFIENYGGQNVVAALF